MKIIKFELSSNLLVSLEKGTVNAIDHDGIIYVPFMKGSSTPAEDDEDDAPEPPKVKKAAPVKESPKTPAAAKPTKIDVSTMTAEDLEDYADEHGLDLDGYKKKNGIKRWSQKSLSAAITEMLASKSSPEENEDDDEPAPVKGGKSAKSESTSELRAILITYEDGDCTEEQLTKSLSKLSTPSVAKAFVKMFSADADMSINTAIQKFNTMVKEADEDGEEEEEDAPPAKAVKKGKKEPVYEEVEADELEEGDAVKVFWADEAYNDWYDGVVTSIKTKGKKTTISITYDEDGEVVVYDPEEHTEIKRKV